MTADKSSRRNGRSDSGKLKIDDATIYYNSRDYGTWSLPVSAVRIVGEYTNDHGPHLDDYFLVFVPNDGKSWHEASAYADGRDEFLATLERLLPGVAQLGLSNSTGWKSRVLWPPVLAGRPLFRIKASTPGPGLWSRVWARFDPRLEITLTEDLLGWISEHR